MSATAGKNAWHIIIFNDSGELSRTDLLEELRVHDGILMGIMGFNSFLMKKFKNNMGEDIFIRELECNWLPIREKGYEFNELAFGETTLDTCSINTPSRNLMKAVSSKMLWF
ncbi:uncharacterized protein EAE97_001495 [Botrytis byssoidea]|uniref:Uncharacterized protein n=1 Tax=Botrytis byssoidea TaxID=139641 RepID=A0A9P5IRY5_9HELO|nr:uncharacterized protein EAE97_001495 [Botrytis byssoidea]KAF7951998.1 hypothetical protein EAE97_001495 [Botrytis byssoidea]